MMYVWSKERCCSGRSWASIVSTLSADSVPSLVGTCGQRRGWSPVHFAASIGHAEVLLTLLRAKADVDLQTEHSWTALHFAAERGHWECVDALLRAGANIGAQTKRMWTPLHWAAFNGILSCVQALLRAGADVDARTDVSLQPSNIDSCESRMTNQTQEAWVYSHDGPMAAAHRCVSHDRGFVLGSPDHAGQTHGAIAPGRGSMEN
eukprot:1181666-Prorocentrum_minimum.AAC.2